MESTIGQRIRQLREAKGLSVADFAAAAGVRPSAIYGLEGGANRPSMKTVTKLQESFPDLNTDWLLTGGGSMYRDGRALTPAPAHFEEIKQGRALPQMAVAKDLDDMSPGALAEYWQMRAEVAEAKLAAIEAEKLHQEIVRLVRAPGGRSFSSASPEAADTEELPFMVAETNLDYVEESPLRRRIGYVLQNVAELV